MSVSTALRETAPVQPAPKKAQHLRILLTSYRSAPTTGGQGVYLRLISKALVEAGHSVDVISGPPYPTLDERVGLIRLPSLDLYATTRPIRAFQRAWLKQPLNLWEWLSHNSGGFPEPYSYGVRLWRYLKPRLHEYDIIHDNQTLCPSLLAIDRAGLPVISTIHHPITRDRAIDLRHTHNPFMWLLKYRWYSFLRMQIKVARKLSRLIVVSQNTQRDVVPDFGLREEQLHLIYHGIDTDVFRPLANIKREPLRLITTASADVPLKGLIYLIRALAQLLPQYPALELKVIGRLREGATAKEIKRWGIGSRIEFLHDLTPAQMCEAFNRATIGVSPSVYEGFGFPAGEMMASGLPVVATTGGSLPEVVGDAGLVVEHSNPSALAQAIAQLLTDEKKREGLAQKARAHICKHFQWDRAADEMIALYRQTIQHRKQGA